MENNFIGIDYSRNSPGICILEKNSCKWINIFRTSNNIQKMIKKEGTAFNILSSSDLFSINIIEKLEFKDLYYKNERNKLLDSIYFSNLVFESILPYINEKTIIGMEGVSFGSSGNSLIDIVVSTTLLRALLIKKINPENFYIISPSAIKKYAVKGNAKKDELYHTLLDKRKYDVRLKPLLTILEENKDAWVKGPKKVENPCSDIIDATWISLFLEDNLEKLLNDIKI
jgi:hypothetical protein